ncbi:MAG: ATP-binding protein [Vicinamibacterales bacterium]
MHERVAQGTRLAVLAAAVAAGAYVLVRSTLDVASAPVDSTFTVLAGLTLATGWATLRMREVPVSFSISDTFTIAAALLYGPSAGTVLVTLDAMVMSLRLRRTTAFPARVLFNGTSTALAMWLSAHAFFAISGTGPLASQPGTIREVIWPLLLFAAAYFILNTGFVATAVAYERRTSIAGVWRQHFSALWLTYFGGAAIAGVLVLMTVARVVDVTTLSLILPLLFILHVTYRAAMDRVHEQVEHLTQIASYAAALRSTTDAVLVTDRDGRVSLMNRAAEELTGWTEEAALGRPATEVFVTRADEATDGEIAADEGALRDAVLVRRDRSRTPVEHMESTIRGDRDEAVGTIKTFRDISARKAIDAERDGLLKREQQARAAADAANRLKDEFVATMSHELRTPSAAMLGWLRLLKSGRMSAEQTARAIESLERNAKAQAALLDDLLDMSRIVHGTLTLDKQPTDLMAVLETAADAVRPAADPKGIHLAIDVPADPVVIHADPGRLRQVFWHLLSNAVKFTDSRGRVHVTVALEPGMVRVDITDTGRGIDPAALPVIFERFRQADGSTTRAHGGVGVGLAIVRHLVESHGGTVTAESEGLGRGARFITRLPTDGRSESPA